MRPERHFLQDMAQAVADVAEFVDDMDFDAFIADKRTQSAVLQKLTVIGEAANRLSAGLKARHPDIPWGDIIGQRNVVAHAYFSLTWPLIWQTAIRDLPVLGLQLAEILGSPADDA